MKKFFWAYVLAIVFSAGMVFAQNAATSTGWTTTVRPKAPVYHPPVYQSPMYKYPAAHIPAYYPVYPSNSGVQGVYYNPATRSYQYYPVNQAYGTNYYSSSRTVYIPDSNGTVICMNKYTYLVVDCEDNDLREDEMTCIDTFSHKTTKCPKK